MTGTSRNTPSATLESFHLSFHRYETPEEKALPILQTAGLVDGLDPTFDVQAFRFLADQYQHRAREEKDLSDACNYNAEVGHHGDTRRLKGLTLVHSPLGCTSRRSR